MSQPTPRNLFLGSIPELYESNLVPMLFKPYAIDLARRVASRSISSMLEIAAGTGVVTRELAEVLPEHVSIVATDLSQPMLDQAATIGTKRPVEWQKADAQQLPYADRSFDAVVCQFGAMFFPNKPKAFSEASRVLKPGGIFIFSVWDSLADNEFALTVSRAMEALFPGNPPRFFEEVPHGYFEPLSIQHDLKAAGFSTPARLDIVTAPSRAASPEEAAIAFCQGTPLRGELEARGAGQLIKATEASREAILRDFGAANIEGKMQALIITVERSVAGR